MKEIKLHADALIEQIVEDPNKFIGETRRLKQKRDDERELGQSNIFSMLPGEALRRWDEVGFTAYIKEASEKASIEAKQEIDGRLAKIQKEQEKVRSGKRAKVIKIFSKGKR